MKYKNIREALDDFPAFDWNDGLNAAVIHDDHKFRQWQKDFIALCENGASDD